MLSLWEKVLANPGRTLAICQIFLALAAAIGYGITRDYRRALYWLFAAALTATVTL